MINNVCLNRSETGIYCIDRYEVPNVGKNLSPCADYMRKFWNS